MAGWTNARLLFYVETTLNLTVGSKIISFCLDYGDETMPGKEVIMMYQMTDFNQNPGEFFTDANGRQMMRRMRNERSYTVDPEELALEPEASNYYPITSGKHQWKYNTLTFW